MPVFDPAIFDDAIFDAASGGGTVFTRTAADTVVVSDAIAEGHYWARTATDTLGAIADAATRVLDLNRIAIETVARPIDTVAYAAIVPVASFTYSPTGGSEPLRVQFTDTSLYHPTEWLWDFGDGETSTEQHPYHIFAAGTWTITLTVTNAAGSDVATA